MERETVRHQVAIAGHVRMQFTRQPVAGAVVQASGLPGNRTAQTSSAADGHFYFLDLPDGEYTLHVSLPGAGTRYGTVEKRIKVSSSLGAHQIRHIKMSPVDIELPTTCLSGTVRAQNYAIVPMAEVRLEGSGEHTFSGADGRYCLTAFEMPQDPEAKRTIGVYVRGERRLSRNVVHPHFM
ncbi:MAG: carboxypeptidase-like regulatory domain-containing protein [Anaerolineae bacterium]|nr:carboxypeptidase-like regulatory domain-containing protein [Anaerolineae bacterium]